MFAYYVWSESFETHDIRWSPDGDHLCVVDRNRVAIVRESTVPVNTKNLDESHLSTIAE